MIEDLEPIGPASGAATPLVLLPANGKSAPFYRPLGQALAARGFRPTLLTLPGFDGTTPLAAPSWAALVDAVRPVVHERLGQGGVLVGHSLGGLLAFLLAAEAGAPPLRLVLMEPAIVPFPRLARVAARHYRRGAIEKEDPGRFVNRAPGFWRLHDPATFPEAAMAHASRCARTTDRATLVALADSFAALQPLPFERVTAPTLLVRAASSGWTQRLGQWVTARRLPNASRVTLPRAGHWMANEQDELLADHLAAFSGLAA